MSTLEFRFNAGDHSYVELATGRNLPSITWMLEQEGLVDPTWFTQASADRGTFVHDMTTAFDLGAMDVHECVSEYRGYLLAHVAATGILRPDWLHVEVPMANAKHRFAGRPDRVGLVLGVKGVLEIKTAVKHKSHAVQTALQAILVADELKLPPTGVQRFAEYLQPNGRFKVEQHKDARDFDEAYRLLRKWAEAA